MYFIMTESVNYTVATTHHKEMAEFIAKAYETTYGERCIIRWAGNGD